MRTLSKALGAAALLATTVAASSAFAGVTRMEITRTAPAFGGKTFGGAGAYEVVEARVFFEVDPKLPVNALIANIQRAPKNARGLVEFDSDIVIVRPADAKKGNGRLFYEPVNRGNILSLGTFMGGGGALTEEKSAGDGFLLERGYTLVFAGWQPTYPIADAPAMSIGGGSRLPPGGGRLQARIPVAKNADGTAIVQRIGAGIGAGPNPPPTGRAVTVYLTYPAADLADRSAYVRNGATGARVDGASWRYIDEWRAEVTLPAGARGPLEFYYEAKDPVVYGLALASMRDVVSFLRYETAGNPLAGRIRHTFGFGASQTGRTIKNLIYHFNDDERGRIVFDGVQIHISGASLNSQNDVFGQPGQKGGEPFPYTYKTLFDPLSRRTDGWLMRCAGTNTCPNVIHTDSDAELSLAGSLVYTDTLGKDVTHPDNVRVYLISSTQHSPAAEPSRGACANLSNPMPYRPATRGLFLALDEWATSGKAPPASRHPRRADNTLVTLEEARRLWPAIPGIKFTEDFPPMAVLDPGSKEQVAGLAYPVFRPRTDSDGNTVAGVRHPEIAAPLGTYTGWNPRPDGIGSCPAAGSYQPLARTKAEREAANDPRLSVEERYPTESSYVAAVKRAADDLVRQRLIVASDAKAIIDGAAAKYQAALKRP